VELLHHVDATPHRFGLKLTVIFDVFGQSYNFAYFVKELKRMMGRVAHDDQPGRVGAKVNDSHALLHWSALLSSEFNQSPIKPRRNITIHVATHLRCAEPSLERYNPEYHADKRNRRNQSHQGLLVE
jgi:hypothetical protein